MAALNQGVGRRELFAIVIIGLTVVSGLSGGGPPAVGFHGSAVGSGALSRITLTPEQASLSSQEAAPRVVFNVSVGDDPFGVAYDGGNGEVFVANLVSKNVSVICDGSTSCGGSTKLNSVVATAPVGNSPEGLAYDSSKGEVYVANSGTNDVSVINGSSNTVVATVAVGVSPHYVGYDSARGELFVANTGSNNVSVICDGSPSCGGPSYQNTVVATIRVGSEPLGVAYDGGNAEVFVADAGSSPGFYGNVSIIADSNNTVVATVAVGTSPVGTTYDSEKGEVFVADYGIGYASGNVSVISDTSNKVVAKVPVGVSPSGVAYDSENGEVFVTNWWSGNVSVISDSLNTVVATVPVGRFPNGAAYDGGKAEVFVANGAVDTVSIISVPNATSRSATPSPSSSLPTLDYVIIGVVVAVVAIGAAVVLIRRRGRAAPPPPPPPPPPGAGSPPAPP